MKKINNFLPKIFITFLVIFCFSKIANSGPVEIDSRFVKVNNSKSTPVDADSILILDSAASNIIKKMTWANLKSFFTSSSLLSGKFYLGNGSNIATPENFTDKVYEQQFTANNSFGKATSGDSLLTTLNKSFSYRDLFDYRLVQALAQPGVTTISTSGMPSAPTSTGTVASADDADGIFLKHTTTDYVNAFGVISAFTITRGNRKPIFIAKIKTDATYIVRVKNYVGLFSASPDSGSVPTESAYFRFDASAGDTNWMCVIASGGNTNVIDTNVPYVADTVYKMMVRLSADGSGTKFYINDVLVGTEAAILLNTTTQLGYGIRVASVALEPKTIRWERIGIMY